MPAEKYRVELTEEERWELLSVVKRGKGSAAQVRRANILLAVDVGEHADLRMSEAEAARAYRASPKTVFNLKRKLVTEGFEGVLERKRRRSPGNVKVDGEAQGAQRNDLSLDIVTDYSMVGGLINDVPTPPKTLTVRLNNSRAFLAGVRTHIQTERYTNVKGGAGERREAILADKRQANRKLYENLRDQMRDLLTHATYNAGGMDITDKVTGSGKDAVQSAALELVRRAWELGADAFIVQDWGLLAQVRRLLPQVECHVSTQANVHDPRGVAW